MSRQKRRVQTAIVILAFALLFICAGVAIIYAVVEVRDAAKRRQVANNLRQIQSALVAYQEKQTKLETTSADISPATADDAGVLAHTVRSPYQSTPTKIRVLLPKPSDPTARYRVLYVLPVEPLDERHWGDAIKEVRAYDLHNKHRLICVFPTFSALPWYADHPTDRLLRQETYFLEVVVPFLDRTYRTMPRKEGRWLLGFSKSGYGAFSLLLRHPDTFGKAVAWDAPLMMGQPNKYGMAGIYGTQENFEKYRLTTLLRDRTPSLAGPVRLIHFGYGNFRDHHQKAHQLMQDLGIPHEYRDGPKREHRWQSGWLAEAVQMLAGSEKTSPSGQTETKCPIPND